MPYSDWQDPIQTEGSALFLSNSLLTDFPTWTSAGSGLVFDGAIYRGFGILLPEWFGWVDAVACCWNLMQHGGMYQTGVAQFNYQGECTTVLYNPDANYSGTFLRMFRWRYVYTSGIPLLGTPHRTSVQAGRKILDNFFLYNNLHDDAENFHPVPPAPPEAEFYEYQDTGYDHATLLSLTMSIQVEVDGEFSPATEDIGVYQWPVTSPGSNWLDGSLGLPPSTYLGEQLGVISPGDAGTVVEYDIPLNTLDFIDDELQQEWFDFLPTVIFDDYPGGAAPTEEYYSEYHWCPAIRVHLTAQWLSPPWRYFTGQVGGWGSPVAS